MKKLKRILIVVLLLIVAFLSYVEIVNWHSKNMTYRQKFLKAVYPALMWFTNLTKKDTMKLSHEKTTPPVSFYSLKDTLNSGQPFDFGTLKGKKVLLVNTASNCGYTGQYEGLQKLSERFNDRLVVIGFPANDFKEQEKGSDEEIAQFCKVNFGVSFPLMKKSTVIKTNGQNPVFDWLAHTAKNGWNEQQPEWNFSKYLISEDGVLLNYFGASVDPQSNEVIEAIEKND